MQWHGKGALPFLHPELRIYQTEQECGDGCNDWRYARYSWDLMTRFLLGGASAYHYWNIALESGGVIRWGCYQNSLVVVDPATRTYEYTHEYYVLKHVSHAVAPGARLVSTLSYTGYENQLAFRNPDGLLVLVVQNDGGSDLPISILVGDQVVRPVLPADSLSTFVLEV
ncbi:glycoside hydrolase family 30 beta sandwich domain-containing protein [Miniimonas arenae]|uniref:glycoside hydrolase family 30 beta sandwich domain-containing protein n=1 Tax=Miniimonas arenae TaxID=676201 RepID=UPI0015D5EFE6|nr:glycoside hydrolase family 30 beta sandwich domain-containing protein [Miniimonas arenae]